MNTEHNWWEEAYGFFGSFYMDGDDSVDGYRVHDKQSLEERTSVEVDGIEKLLQLHSGATILDCPTGYGRHAIELGKRGYSVTGVDLNTAHLEAAQKNITAANGNVQFEQGNMLTLNYEAQFDAVLNMFYSFGFFETDEENFQVLENFYRALKPGGQFLMHTDVNIPFIQAGKYKHDETRTLQDGGSLRIIDEYNTDTKRIDGAWIIQKAEGSEVRKDYSVRVYSKEEFVELCMQAGFTHCDAYANWDGSPYSADEEDMIIVATK